MKKNEKDVRNLQKSRNTYYVTLPADLVREFGWQERQKLTVKRLAKGKLVVGDWKAKKSK